MAPPRPPPELSDDAIAEVLVRVPPDEPAFLFRAALVCKAWRRILSDPAFPRRYRDFHGAPPMLGFFHNIYIRKLIPCFVPTTAASPFPQPPFGGIDSLAHDCRHGRVLFEQLGGGDDLIVWDPITGDRKGLEMPRIPRAFRSFTVLCANRGCDHRSCHGGPFLVVCVGTSGIDGVMHACVYRSEAAAWGAVASLDLSLDSSISMNRGALVRDKIYMVVQPETRILEHDLREHRLAVIELPDEYDKDVELGAMEDGSLGLVGITDSSLYLWFRKVNQEGGTAAWIQWRVIELQKLLPVDRPCKSADVIGFAEGVGVIFLRTDAGTFMYELKSGRVRKIMDPGNYSTVCPFMSFFTPDCASGRLILPAETH